MCILFEYNPHFFSQKMSLDGPSFYTKMGWVGGWVGGDRVLIRIPIETNSFCDFSVWGSGLALLIYFLSYYPKLYHENQGSSLIVGPYFFKRGYLRK